MKSPSDRPGLVVGILRAVLRFSRGLRGGGDNHRLRRWALMRRQHARH